MTHYEILGIKKTATTNEIKHAYKKLVKKYHPDVYVGDKTFAEKKIKEINEAYDILSDPEQKREYDESISPQPTTNYTYTPPQYNYTASTNSYKTSKRNTEASSSKYSYENYRKTYNSTNYGSYDYQRRYTDYHRSKTPNSNYSSNNKNTINYAENVANIFSNFSNSGKIIVITLIAIFFIAFFITNTIQITSLLGQNNSSVISAPDYSSTIDEPKENDSYETRNPYLEPNEESSSSDSTNSDLPTLEEFDINDVFTDAELLAAYTEYGGSNYATFEEFKEAIKLAYYNTYILPFLHSF